ncbi:MAG: lysine-sensitive aspartokinase 3, partial [Halobacteriovoraceae bacterium]|nr:lysine-sensitive aspartokinase 3 [Halobacteriovoraceae bacterium]
QADPRLYPRAAKFNKMTYTQARAIAQKGAKVLFPKTLDPLKDTNISVFIKNSHRPKEKGTWIFAD